MKFFKKILNNLLLGMLFAILGTTAAMANVSMLHDFHFDHPVFVHDHPFADRKLVVQVSQANPARWNLVLNTSQNILNYFGQQKAQIVIVAFGPGLKFLLANSPMKQKIAALNAEGVEFDACHNTMCQSASKFEQVSASNFEQF
jgi:intracellular sulfur oxidation DsrE/DsrF family protein